MRADMTFTGEKGDSPIVARVGDGKFGLIEFRQGGDSFILVLPPHMKSCLETIARVFNECMSAGPDCESPDTKPDRGQYIGLTRTDYPFRNVE